MKKLKKKALGSGKPRQTIPEGAILLPSVPSIAAWLLLG